MRKTDVNMNFVIHVAMVTDVAVVFACIQFMIYAAVDIYVIKKRIYVTFMTVADVFNLTEEFRY